MRTAVLETREDKIRENGWESVDSVPLGGTAVMDLMDKYLYHEK